MNTRFLLLILFTNLYTDRLIINIKLIQKNIFIINFINNKLIKRI